MYKCLACGETFDTPDTYEDHHPYGMGYATERWSICPCCGDTDFEDYHEDDDEEEEEDAASN